MASCGSKTEQCAAKKPGGLDSVSASIPNIGKDIRTRVRNIEGVIAKNGEWLAILAIVFLGASLRLYHLGRWSFWIDEIFTLQIASGFPYNITQDFFFAIREHPVTSALIFTAVNTLGTSELTARLMPALVGIATIPLLYWHVKKVFNIPVALLTSLFLSVSPWHIYWSQNARFYTALFLFYWLSLFYFYSGILLRKRILIVGSIFFMILAMSERLLGVFIFPIASIISLHFVLNNRPQREIVKYVILMACFGLVAAALFGINFLQDPQLWQEIYMIPNSAGPLNIAVRHLQAVDLHIVLFGVLGGLHLFYKKEPVGVFLIVAIGVPLIITLTLSTFQFTHPRYTFVSLMAWLILAAVGVNQIFVAIKPNKFRILHISVILLTGLLLSFSELKDYVTLNHGGRDNWRSAFYYVDQVAAPDDVLFTNEPTVGAYYSKRLKPESMRDLSALSRQVMQCQLPYSVWFVIGGKGRANHEFAQWVRTTAVLEKYDDPNIKIYRLTQADCP